MARVQPRLVNVGYGNVVAVSRLITVVSPDAAPIRRLVQEARDAGKVVDATCGHRTRSVLVMDSDHVILSPLQPETVAARVDGKHQDEGMEDEA